MKNAVKLIKQENGEAVIGGYGVVFGGVDLDGDTFTKDTDFWLDRVTQTPMVLYQHGGDEAIKDTIIGRVTKAIPDDVGLWIEAQVNTANQYRDAILKLIEEGVLGWSSGAIGHLVSREKTQGPGKNASIIKSWPIVEFSLTPTPAEPRTIGVERIKQIATEQPDLKVLLPEAGQETGGTGDGTDVEGQQKTPIKGENIMTIEITQDEFDRRWEDMAKSINALEKKTLATVEGFSGQLEKVMSVLDKLPEQKKAGYIADPDDVETSTKSFGDFLVSVKRGDSERLAKVYKSTKDMSGQTGGAGGYIVPDDWSTELLSVMTVDNAITSRCRNIPVSRRSGQYPTLDVFITPTAGSGQTAMAAGVRPTVVAEGAAFSGENEPTFELLEWTVGKIGDIVDVPIELSDDAPALEALLRSLFQIAIDSMVERHVLRGAGGAEFLGILNSAAAISVTTATNNTFAAQDALNMLAQFKPMPGGNPVWLMHRGVIADFNATNFPGNAQDFMRYDGGIPAELHQYPIIFSEHLPQDDNAGDVILADLRAYLIFNRQQLTIGFSEHAKFENDLVVWKYKIRADGKPWLKSSITLADPQGSYTVSPFVYHND